MLSAPAAITTSCVPDMTACAANWTACCDEPHWRSIVTAGPLAGSEDGRRAFRPNANACSPAWVTQPRMTSSTAAGSIPVRATSASSISAARLAGWHPANLAAEILDALVARTGIDPAAVEDVILGCVTQAGEQAFAFGRNALLPSSLPASGPAVTIDRQCGSSQQAVQFAAQAVMSGTQDVVIAAGAESMSRVPMFSNVALHQQAGIGTGPISDRIQARFGVENFSQFEGAEMIA